MRGGGGGIRRDTSTVDQPDVDRDKFPQDWRPFHSTPSAALPIRREFGTMDAAVAANSVCQVRSIV